MAVTISDQKYDPGTIEPKWQRVWEEKGLYKTPQLSKGRPKKYVLDMFPYPSGAQLHVGHMEGYVGTDVVSRYYRMKGYSVLHPMGWDAFGLPAENYAIKTGIGPDKSTHENIKTFKKQLQMLGLSYDWDREIDTSSPDYYKWTQWLFIKLFEMGLAYKKKAPANWCPKDETVLANEQVVDGKCERCGTEVVQKELDQWFFKITAYADALIDGLNRIDWPKPTKLMQKNWIGRKEGFAIKFGEIEVFTTRPDTIFGATFVVLSPKHPLANRIKVVTNPINKKQIPVFVDEYVLDEVGTGAIMGVPGHDQRDFDFAKRNSLPIVEVVSPTGKPQGALETSCEEYGILLNSGKYSGMKSEEAMEKIVADLGPMARKTISYHLRDWLVSRQRYWGAPIPMIFCAECAKNQVKSHDKEDSAGWFPVPLEELPVKLPTDVDFKPTGESPIARSKSFQKGVRCSNCGGQARREVDTMDTFVDSSWYFLRFLDPRNNNEFAPEKDIDDWMPVDIYVGGGHTVQHLLFARFFERALVDAGLIGEKFAEPFARLVVPGWILGPDSRKMSKRWNNVITPDEVVAKFGADTMRIYEMFMAPFEVDKPWNVNSVAGVNRFVRRIYGQVEKNIGGGVAKTDPKLSRLLSKLTNKVSGDIETFNFNTAIAAMMAFLNDWEKSSGLAKADLEIFLKLLAPFAPHLAEELWQGLVVGSAAVGAGSVISSRARPLEVAYSLDPGSPVRNSALPRAAKNYPRHRLSPAFMSIHKQPWPEVGETASDEAVTIVVSVNGKPRSTVTFGSREEKMLGEKGVVAKAKDEKVAKYLTGKAVRRTVYVPNKIVNFVTS